MSLRTQLMGLVLAAVFPILLFACTLIAFLAYQQKKSIEQNLRSTTRALAFAVDEQMTSIISSLQMLGQVEDFNKSNFPDLHRRLKRYVKAQDGWISISLAYPDGSQLINTLYDTITDRHNWQGEPFFDKLIETGKPSISGFRVSKISKKKCIAVAIPVKRNGSVEYVIVAIIYAKSITKLLLEQHLPTEWTAAILDEDSVIVARSRKDDEFAGRRATDKLADLIHASNEDFFEDINQEGQASYGAFSRSRSTNWSIVLGIPMATSQFQAWKIFWIVVGGGTLLLMISLSLAIYFGIRISKPIIALSDRAKLLGRGENVGPVESGVREILEVSEALVEASLQRDHSEEAMKDLYEKAKEAVELRDTFLSVASHELKTPLTSLKLQFQLLERIVGKNDSVTAASLKIPFGRVLDQVRRLTLLVDDLLDVSRIAANKMELHFEKVELKNLLEEIANQFESEARKAGSPLRLSLGSEVIGTWDRGRLEQIFTNLISNAIKYGNGNPIDISLEKNHSTVRVNFTDHGIGIAPLDQQRIFERYERAVGERSISGLGLGLWIVQRIVDRLGGKIHLQSTPGEGSTFTVTLPVE
jgi:signal transduction histidine kinase